MIQTPDRSASHTDVSRQVGDGDATIRPTADAKLIRTNDVAAATIAPAMPGPQWRYESGPPGVAIGPAAGPIVSIVAIFESAQRRPRNDRIAKTTTIRPTR